jgi:tetratricopeptide (TPR) repeat protein
MNDPSPPANHRWSWIAIVIVIVTVALVAIVTRSKHPDDFDPRAPRTMPAAMTSTELRRLADAVQLRFIEDESARAPAEKLQRALDGVARAQKLTPEALRAHLTRYLDMVGTDGQHDGFTAVLAATLRGDLEAASRAAPIELEVSPADALAAPLAQIQAHTFAGRHDEAARLLADLRARTDRTREPEAWARVQAAAFILSYAQQHLDDAFALAREVLQIRERVLPPDSPGLANALHNVAVCLARRQRDDEAAPLFTRAIGIYEKAYGPDDLTIADTASELAAALSDSDHLPEAEAVARRAIAIFERAGESAALPLALALDRLGDTLLAAKRAADAEPALRRAVAIYDRHADARAKDHADAVHRLGLAIARQDRRREALPHLRRSTEIAARWFADDDPLLAVYFHNFAVWSDAAGDDPGTVAAYERALQILARNRHRIGREPGQMRQTTEFYTAYLKSTGISEAEVERRVQEAVEGP